MSKITIVLSSCIPCFARQCPRFFLVEGYLFNAAMVVNAMLAMGYVLISPHTGCQAHAQPAGNGVLCFPLFQKSLLSSAELTQAGPMQATDIAMQLRHKTQQEPCFTEAKREGAPAGRRREAPAARLRS